MVTTIKNVVLLHLSFLKIFIPKTNTILAFSDSNKARLWYWTTEGWPHGKRKQMDLTMNTNIFGKEKDFQKVKSLSASKWLHVNQTLSSVLCPSPHSFPPFSSQRATWKVCLTVKWSEKGRKGERTRSFHLCRWADRKTITRQSIEQTGCGSNTNDHHSQNLRHK